MRGSDTDRLGPARGMMLGGGTGKGLLGGGTGTGVGVFDLEVDWLGMVGVNGSKFPAIRQHLQDNIAQVYKDMDTSYVQCITVLPRRV